MKEIVNSFKYHFLIVNFHFIKFLLYFYTNSFLNIFLKQFIQFLKVNQQIISHFIKITLLALLMLILIY